MFFLIKTSNRRLLLLIIFYIAYLFVGAAIFDQLESPHEEDIIRELNLYVKMFRDKHNACISDEDLNNFIRLVSIANDKGVPAVRNVSKEQNWSFGQAVFFAGTIVATIGYGNVSPLTKLGKVFCMFFAIVGIPITLLLLYAIIERLMKLTGSVLAYFTEKSYNLFNKISIFSQRVQRSHMHVLFTLLCTLMVFVFLIVIPAAIYASIEDWSYLNAFYYCFISLSTVGLGDYVPGDSDEQQNRHLYKIFSTIYLLFGVLVMVWLLEIYSETPDFNIYQYFTLTKDGLLTSHGDTIHLASSKTTSYSSSNLETAGSSSPVTYQRQFNDNLSDTILNTQSVNIDSHEGDIDLNINKNYISLDSVPTNDSQK